MHIQIRLTTKNLVVTWLDSETPGDSNETISTQYSFENLEFKNPVLVDLRTGIVYEIHDSLFKYEDGNSVFTDVPVYDSPVLIAEKDLIDIK